jgi:autophagy-related protein 16
MLLQELHQLILERNVVETDPFVAVHEANASLMKQVDGLQNKCDALERDHASISNSSGSTTMALRNETRLRDKLEQLQEELNAKLKVHQKDTNLALDTANALAQIKESHAALEQKIKKMEQEAIKKDKKFDHLQQQLQDAEATTKLAEKQYMGLKETIRSLQNENDILKKENSGLIDRIVGSKEKTSDEVNALNEMIDALKKEVDMLRTLKVQDDKRQSWFGGSKAKSNTDKAEEEEKKKARKFGTMGCVVPSGIQHLVRAHAGDATCVRYDATGDFLATCGTDSTVKIWESNTGNLRATLRGAYSITACDIGGGLAVGGGSDKMCRVWNIKTERMVCAVFAVE